MISKAEWQYEQEWLATVLEVIRTQLQVGQEQAERYRHEIVTTHRQMWKDLFQASGDFEEDFDMMLQSNQMMKERKVQILTRDFYQKMVRRLSRMEQTPYFGRIDFQERGEELVEKLYIGLATLFDENEDPMIYDWRAPISSMFYDYQPGPAEYDSKYDTVKGEILLKRQYKIAAGEIEYMFDTNIKIDDDILQSILGQHSTGKMKQIVTTIQKEQNQIIRDEEHQLLIVQGAAGSGKTSIALHRVAYLLYTYRNSLKSENILIFSPNYLFSDYISNVLPELGEENMAQITFHEYAELELEPEFVVEDVNDQLDYFLSQKRDETEYQIRVQSTQYKGSADFVQVMKNYIHFLEEEGVVLEDILCQGKMIISKEELIKLWRKVSYLPFTKRLNKLQGRIKFLLRKFKKKEVRRLAQEIQPVAGEPLLEGIRNVIAGVRKDVIQVKKQVEKMLSADITKMFLRLFREEEVFERVATGTVIPDEIVEICQRTIDSFAAGQIQYEDVIPFLYFKLAITGRSILKKRIKYVVVDEAQDYSPFHYELIRFLFPESKLTLLGDLNQSIHPYIGIGQYQRIADIFQIESTRMVQLKNSYRSTTEIVKFAQGILPADPGVRTVDRPGEKPEVVQIADPEMEAQALRTGICDLKDQGAESVAVVCKTAAESERVYNLLKDDLPIELITRDTFELHRELVVIPSYLAKGLEFDGILVVMNEGANYTRSDEAHLFYTICTRALHYLKLYSVGSLSPFIENMDDQLYELRQYQFIF